MNHTTQLDRIAQQLEIMGGKACIRGTRVTVSMLVGQIAAGRTIEDILTDHSYVDREDILQAVRYAARCVTERAVETHP
jgi:uncharacterized protein (DUF433 family)